MKFQQFIAYIIYPVFKPVSGLKKLIQDPDNVSYGLIALVVPGLMYRDVVLTKG